jgi:hypothetical protein
MKLAALAEAFGQIEYAFELLDWLARRDDVPEPLARDIRHVIIQGRTEYEQFSCFNPQPDQAVPE